MAEENFDNPFSDNPELLKAGAAFISHLNDKFPTAQALVDALESAITELCFRLQNLAKAFATGAKEFEEKSGDNLLVLKRYRVLTDPQWLCSYLTPVVFTYLFALWKEEHADEPTKLDKILKRVRGYEAAWHAFAEVLLRQTGGDVHAFELTQRATMLCNHLSLALSTKSLGDAYVDYARTRDEIAAILRQLAAKLAAEDLREEAKAEPADEDEAIETYDASTRPRYTQQLAAKLIGVTPATIANWESGRTAAPPGYSKALRRCKGQELIQFAESYRARIHNENLASPKATLKKP